MLQPMRLTFLRNLNFWPLVAGPIDADQTRDWIDPPLTQSAVRRDLRKLFSQIKPRELADAGSRLDRFQKPVLLCWAPKDPFFRISHARRLVEVLPDARLVEIPDSRTFVPVDQPTRLAAEIAAFVPAPAAKP